MPSPIRAHTLSHVELTGIQNASRQELVSFAAAIADNGDGLLADAELLAVNRRFGRAYSMAALSVEEYGKATGVLTLAVMPDDLRARAPVGQLIEWHAVKQLGGLLLSSLQLGSAPGVAGMIVGSSVGDLGQLLGATQMQAQDTDRQKKRGLYVDLDAAGVIWRPDNVTEAEATEQVERARQVSASAGIFRDSIALAKLSNPPAEALAVSAALFSWYLTNAEPQTAHDAAQIAKDTIPVIRAALANATETAQP